MQTCVPIATELFSGLPAQWIDHIDIVFLPGLSGRTLAIGIDISHWDRPPCSLPT